MTIMKSYPTKEFYGNVPTFHYSDERASREALITKIGIGEPVASFVVDKGHINGLEIHQITTTGIILIYNMNSHKLVTKLIARPAQIMRYFSEDDKPIPYEILNIAMEHEKMGYNE